MAADDIVEKVTGKSLTDRVISPLVEKYVMPMVKKLGDVVTKALEGLGVNAEIASYIGMAVGAIGAVVAVVAVLFAAKNAGGKLVGALLKAVGKMMGRLAAKAIQTGGGKAVLSGAARAAQSSVGKATQSSATQLGKTMSSVHNAVRKQSLADGEVLGPSMQMLATGATAADASAQAGVGVFVGVQERAIDDALARQIEISVDIDVISKVFDRAVSDWLETTRRITEMAGSGVDVFNREMAAGA